MFLCIFTCSSFSFVHKSHYAINACHACVIHVISTCALNHECIDTVGYWSADPPPGSSGYSLSLAVSSPLHSTVKTTSCPRQEVSHHLLHSREPNQCNSDWVTLVLLCEIQRSILRSMILIVISFLVYPTG